MTSQGRRSGWVGYVALVFGLSLPFYALGLTQTHLPFVTALPLSAIMAVVPAVAAIILSGNRGGVRTLLGRLRYWPRLGWAAFAIACMPLLFWLTAVILDRVGAGLPEAQWLPVTSIALSLIIFLVGAVGEELGWQGYLYPRMRGAPLQSAMVLGVIWALWHVVPFAEMGRSGPWIVWHCLATVAMRVVIVWLVENTAQSVMIAVLFHMMANAPWGAVANFEAFYDPMIAAVLLWLIVGAIIAIYGPAMGRGGV